MARPAQALKFLQLTCQCLFSAYYRPCSNPSCNERLEFDGGEVALLNMEKFVLTYAVLRDFMFHFLLGRYVLLFVQRSIIVHVQRINIYINKYFLMD